MKLYGKPSCGTSVNIVLLSLLLGVAAGCGSPVVPDVVVSSAASYDGNAQNSGILGSSQDGFQVTNHFIVRYNTMIAVYGKRFNPQLFPNEGVKSLNDGTYIIDREHMVKFILMNSWRKSGR